MTINTEALDKIQSVVDNKTIPQQSIGVPTNEDQLPYNIVDSGVIRVRRVCNPANANNVGQSQ